MRWRAVVVFAMLTGACVPRYVRQYGYTDTNKVWYHWVVGQDDHYLVVCDVAPDGSEQNCKSTKI